jgi:hypothetical protein
MIEEPKFEQPLDERLDEALEMTFPASDPIAVHSSDPRPTRPPRTEESSYRGPVRGDIRGAHAGTQFPLLDEGRSDASSSDCTGRGIN